MDESTFKKLLEEALTSLKADVAQIKRTQDAHSDLINNRILPSLTEIEVTVKSYKDAYQVNKDNIVRLDKILSKVEDNSNIVVPSDLAIHV